MITVTSLTSKRMNRELRNALWLARLQAARNRKHGIQDKGIAYVQNRHGKNVLRIDVYQDKTVAAWGELCSDKTTIILQAGIRYHA